MRGIKIKPLAIQYHRNGVSGNGFHVIRFREASINGSAKAGSAEMVGIVFEEKGSVAVLQVSELVNGNIGDGNKWRGDDFEPSLRQAIELELEETKS